MPNAVVLLKQRWRLHDFSTNFKIENGKTQKSETGRRGNATYPIGTNVFQQEKDKSKNTTGHNKRHTQAERRGKSLFP